MTVPSFHVTDYFAVTDWVSPCESGNPDPGVACEMLVMYSREGRSVTPIAFFKLPTLEACSGTEAAWVIGVGFLSVALA